MRPRIVPACFGLIAAAVLAAAMAAEPDAAAAGESPVVAYASLDSDRVNLRTGPGLRYPVQWVFQRSGWPVEIVSEFGYWRKVRDIDGTSGWIHQNLLSGRRRVVVTGDLVPALAAPEPGAAAAMHMEQGVVADLEECDGAWCRIAAAGRVGWVPRDSLWGVDAGPHPVPDAVASP